MKIIFRNEWSPDAIKTAVEQAEKPKEKEIAFDIDEDLFEDVTPDAVEKHIPSPELEPQATTHDVKPKKSTIEEKTCWAWKTGN